MDPNLYLRKILGMVFAFLFLIFVMPTFLNAFMEALVPSGDAKTNSEDEPISKVDQIRPRMELVDTLKEPLHWLTSHVFALAIVILAFALIVSLLAALFTVGEKVLNSIASSHEVAAKQRLNRKIQTALDGHPSYIELKALEETLLEMEQTERVKERLEAVRTRLERLRSEEEANQLASIDMRLKDVMFAEDPPTEDASQQDVPKSLPSGEHESLGSLVGTTIQSGRAYVRRRVRRS